MLSFQADRQLTQVGPGTPLGELMRRYWRESIPSVRRELTGFVVSLSNHPSFPRRREPRSHVPLGLPENRLRTLARGVVIPNGVEESLGSVARSW